MEYCAAVLFVLAVPLLLGKGSFLVAGYNTASNKEKQRYDERKLCQTVGLGIFATAVLTLTFAFMNTMKYTVLFILLYCFIWIVTIICANTKCIIKR